MYHKQVFRRKSFLIRWVNAGDPLEADHSPNTSPSSSGLLVQLDVNRVANWGWLREERSSIQHGRDTTCFPNAMGSIQLSKFNALHRAMDVLNLIGDKVTGLLMTWSQCKRQKKKGRVPWNQCARKEKCHREYKKEKKRKSSWRTCDFRFLS